MKASDTIAAIATAPGSSGISIIRISGQDAVRAADQLFVSKKEAFHLEQAESHTIHYGHICYDGKVIDEVLVSVMRGPRSYTGEDTVEINCHGGIYVTRRILAAVAGIGVRMAEPGEFTKRAFLNGRMDLSQAEAVIDVINAENDFALNSSIGQLAGKAGSAIRRIRESILAEIAHIEAALDDPEHISLDGYPEHLLEVSDQISGTLSHLLTNADNGSVLKNGINTLILGKPNSGKSTLLNRMAGRERAIVTDIAGTTRDTLEEKINLNGLTLNLIDTAGIRETEDVIEKMGVDKALSQISQADLVLYVADGADGMDAQDLEILSRLSGKRVIILANKSDLKPEEKENRMSVDFPVVSISALYGDGMEELYHLITEMFFRGEILQNDDIYLTNQRQKDALSDALGSMKLVIQSIRDQMPEDFFSIDLMNAYSALGRIIGEEVEEDLIDQIFSRFCMGK